MQTIGSAKPIITKFNEFHVKRRNNKPAVMTQVTKSTGLSPVKQNP